MVPPLIYKMIRNKCQICGIRAIYNIEGESFGIYCNTHRDPGMQDIINRPCHHPGCKVRPSFNYSYLLVPTCGYILLEAPSIWNGRRKVPQMF
jgi:hypothetical protein